MLRSGDVSFDFGFEWCLGSATGYVAKISMLRLNIGSGMLRLSSCMLRLSLTSSVQGGRGTVAARGGVIGLMR